MANDVVSFNKESYIFFHFDEESDAYNPDFIEEPIVFGSVDMADESSFILIVLIEIKKTQDLVTYEIYGMNVLPTITQPDTIMNGVFEVPLLDLELSAELFQELNNISPWQFQFRYIKEKKAEARSASIIFRQNNADLADMYQRKSFPTEINKMFVQSTEQSSPKQKRQNLPSTKVGSVLHKKLNRRTIENDIKEILKDKLYSD